MASQTNPRLLWKPRAPSEAMLSKLRHFINDRHSLDLKNYRELWTYSTDVQTTNAFWVDLFIFLELWGDKVPRVAFASHVRDSIPPQLRWLVTDRANRIENLFSLLQPGIRKSG